MNLIKFKEIIIFILLYILMIISNHVLLDVINQIILVIVIILFIVSKDNYLWLALFTVMLNFAGGFFSYFVKYPMIIGIPFDIVIIIAMIIKVIYSNKLNRVYYLIPYGLLICHLIILRLFTGFDIIDILKHNSSFALLILLPSILYKHSQIENYIKLIYIGVIVVLIGQWFHILSGQNMAGMLFGVASDEYYRIIARDIGGFVRSVEGIGISFIALIGCLYMISIKPKQNINYIMLMISFISIWITGTRGWMLASIIVVVPTVFMFEKKRIVTFMLFISFFLIMIWQVEYLNRQVTHSLERLQTVESIAEGDLTADGTLSRLTHVHDRVWNKFLESPIVGFGYSEEYYNYSNIHVGNQNLLLNVGIIGFILFILLIFSLILNMYKIGRKNSNIFMTTSLLILSIIGVFIIHSTSRQMFGYGINFNWQYIIAFVFTLSNIVYYNHKYMLNNIKHVERK